MSSSTWIDISISDALSVIGTLVGIYGIYLTLRRVRYPASLTFVREQSVALLDDFAMKLPNLTVAYKNAPVDKSVVLISGFLVNDGSVDISVDMVEKPLICKLPEGCSWLEFKITTTAKALHASSTLVNTSEVEIQLGLFRRDESFAFQALALISDEYAQKKLTTFSKDLQWVHRIASLGEIKKILMPEPETKTRTKRIILKSIPVIFSLIYAFLGFSFALGIGPIGHTPSIAYEYKSGEKNQLIRLIANNDKTTTVKYLNTEITEKVELSTLTNAGVFTPVILEKNYVDTDSLITGIAMVLASLVMIYITFINDYKRYKIKRMVSSSTEEAL